MPSGRTAGRPMASGTGPRSSAARRRHWESIYRTQGEESLSWHQEEPTLSFRLITGVSTKSDRVVDIGGGSSPLAERLRRAGYRRTVVLDISPSALGRNRTRAGGPATGIRYRIGDLLALGSLGRFDLWHDRAVFHFLTSAEDRKRYVDLAARTLPVGGHAIVATFSQNGPERCSGLPVQRYDARGLAREFGPRFAVRTTRGERHRTPWNAVQPFSYFVLERVRAGSARDGSRATPRPPGPAPSVGRGAGRGAAAGSEGGRRPIGTGSA